MKRGMDVDIFSKKISTSFPSISFGVFTNRTNTLKVAIIHPGYGYNNVSYGLPIDNVTFFTAKTFPVHRLLIKEKNKNFYMSTPLVLDGSANLIHSWNHLPISRIPFVVSFENELPRYLGGVSEGKKRIGYQLLASKRCRAILALSEAAKFVAIKRFIERGYPEIAEKIILFRGGVESVKPVEKYKFGISRKVLRLIFIGGFALPKGIVPILCALKRLVDKGYAVEFHFVGMMRGQDGYVLDGYNSDRDTVLDDLRDLSWFHDYGALSHSKVIGLMKESDVLLLPSLDETLGWVTIEASMVGIPSIVSNVFALPELVDDSETGFVIDLELNKQEKRWVGITSSHAEKEKHIACAYRIIEQGVYAKIKYLYENPDMIEVLGRAAHEKIYKMYNVDGATEKLKYIYMNAMKG